MDFLNELWRYISNFGVVEEMNSRLERKVKLTNQLAFLGGTMSFIQLFAYANIPSYALLCAGSVIIYALTWYFNSLKKYNSARMYFALSSCLVILIGGCLVTETINMAFKFMLIQALVIPLVVFDLNEKRLQFITVICFLICFIGFDNLNRLIPLIDGVESSMFDSPQTVLVNGCLCMVTLFIGYRYLQKLNLVAENSLEEALKLAHERHVEILKKNEFIKEGINYAQQIQQAVLPRRDDIQVYIPDHFVLFRPKEIIGGDFYWHGEYQDHILLAAVDCTGHGTPGALISIIGSQLLDKIVKEQGVTDPAEVLEILNLDIVSTLQRDKSVLKDGMDISLLSIDTRNKTVQFAGAKNSLLLMKDGEITRIRGQRTSIGETHMIADGFTTHLIDLDDKDCLFLCTDGVIDQFGGPSNKKFLRSRLFKTLTSNAEYSMDIQLDCLKRSLDVWQGDEEQTDDILVIGLRLNFEHISQVKSFRKTGNSEDSSSHALAS